MITPHLRAASFGPPWAHPHAASRGNHQPSSTKRVVNTPSSNGQVRRVPFRKEESCGGGVLGKSRECATPATVPLHAVSSAIAYCFN